MRQASTTSPVPVLVTMSAPFVRTRRLRAVVSTLNRELDSQDVEGRPNTASPWAYIDGDNIVVQVYPGVTTVGAVKQRVRRAIRTATFYSAVPLQASQLAMS